MKLIDSNIIKVDYRAGLLRPVPANTRHLSAGPSAFANDCSTQEAIVKCPDVTPNPAARLQMGTRRSSAVELPRWGKARQSTEYGHLAEGTPSNTHSG